MTPETEELILSISDLARGGAGVARDAGGRVIFVPYTAPGDQVRVEIVSAEKRYAQGRLLEIIQPSPDRQKPPCPVFGRCGGCSWQHLPYELQWKTKSRGVEHALSRLGVTLERPLEPLPAERIWEYRNRIQLRGTGREIGFYESGSTQLVPVDRCEIARPELNALWEELRSEGARLDRPYKVEVEVTEDGKTRQAWNKKHAALGFRQIHDEQNEKLRAWVSSVLQPGRPVYDLFGGSGNLSQGLAASGREVHCVDLGSPRQRPENTPESLHFHRAPTLNWLVRRQPSAPGPWAAILDPPREGLGRDHGDIAAALERLDVREIVAVGCDPDAWAKDVSKFLKRGKWTFERGAVLDLFPQTPHVESLAYLVRR